MSNEVYICAVEDGAVVAGVRPGRAVRGIVHSPSGGIVEPHPLIRNILFIWDSVVVAVRTCHVNPYGTCAHLTPHVSLICQVQAIHRAHKERVLELLGRPVGGNVIAVVPDGVTPASDPKTPLLLSAGELGPLVFRPVDTPPDSALWNELIERYHYLGYQSLPGAQIRYLVYGRGHLLAALGFGAAAWKVAPRDRFIGWSAQQRRANLHRIVNNARFLILPWVTIRNLASRILAISAKRLPNDWASRYGDQPCLLETFVECDRFPGTCYRAANWIYVGDTQGRGKLDRHHRHALPVKHVYLYPLHRHFRRKLQATKAPQLERVY